MVDFCICFLNKRNPEFRLIIIKATSTYWFSIKFWQVIINGNVSPNSIDIQSNIIKSIGVDLLIFNQSLNVFFSFC